MTFGGWFMLITSVGSVVTLFVWCLYKVITIPEETDHIHGFNETRPDAED